MDTLMSGIVGIAIGLAILYFIFKPDRRDSALSLSEEDLKDLGVNRKIKKKDYDIATITVTYKNGKVKSK